jgi:hypothetical protein
VFRSGFKAPVLLSTVSLHDAAYKDSLIVTQLVKFLALLVTGVPIPWSQDAAIGSYPESIQCSPHSHILFH